MKYGARTPASERAGYYILNGGVRKGKESHGLGTALMRHVMALVSPINRMISADGSQPLQAASNGLPLYSETDLAENVRIAFGLCFN